MTPPAAPLLAAPLLAAALLASPPVDPPAAPNLSAAPAVVAEDLASFLEPFYEDPAERRVTDDLEFQGDRLYVAHGYTNTKTPQQLIYFDLAANAYGRHGNPDGTPRTWRIEKLYRTQRFGGELFILDYDPLSGPAKLLRVGPGPGYAVRTQHVSNDAHNRDVYAHGGRLFVSHGRSDVPWPQMRWSADDGETWEQIDQRGVSEPALYECFFPHGGRLYAGTHSRGWRDGFRPRPGMTLEELAAGMEVKAGVPWLIRTADPAAPAWAAGAPWEPVVTAGQVGALLGTHPDGANPLSSVIMQAVDLGGGSEDGAGGGVLALIAGRAYRFASFDPPRAVPVALGEGVTVADLYRDYSDADGRAWVLAHAPPAAGADGADGADGTIRAAIFEWRDGRPRPAAAWDGPMRPRRLAVRGGTAYVGYPGRLSRVRLPGGD